MKMYTVDINIENKLIVYWSPCYNYNINFLLEALSLGIGNKR